MFASSNNSVATSSEHNHTTHYITLDGLRGIAALFVVALHALSPFDKAGTIPHAHLAVDFFFLLSGFVIAHAYERRLTAGMSLAAFLKIRLIRLYPLLLLGLLLGFGIYVAKTVFLGHADLSGDVFLALLASLLILPTNIIKTEGWQSIAPFNVPTWSLFFEFVINIIYVLVLPKLRNRALMLLVALSGVFVFVQAYHLGAVKGGMQWDDLFYGMGRVTFPFFAGVLLYRFHRTLRVRALPFPLLGAALALTFVGQGLGLPVWLIESLFVVLLYPAIVLFASQTTPTKAMASACRFLGDLSYPLYILHYPLIRLFSSFARKYAATDTQLYGIIALEILCQVVFAYGVMKLFDEPLRKWLGKGGRSVKV